MSKLSKNIKWFVVGLLAVVLLAIIICPGCDIDRGNDFSMAIPGNDPYEDHNIKAVTLYVDFSGSMRGFVDGRNRKNPLEFDNFKAGMISNVGHGLTNLAYKYSVTPKSICETKTYDNKGFLAAMENHSIFNKNVTLLNDLLSQCINSVSDTSIGILVSDMVLSYGRNKLEKEKNPSYNKHHLADLSGKVYETLMDAKSNKDMHVVLLQYLSDYNGHYYCNYTENIEPNRYDTVLMKQRPFYVFLCGTENNLRSIMAKECFEHYENVYASFALPQPEKQDFKVEPAHPAIWHIGDDRPDNKDKGTVWTNADEDDSQENLTIRCKSFCIPTYVKANPDLEFSQEVFASVEGPTMYNNGFVFSARLKPYRELKKNMNASISLVTNGNWMASSSTDNDIVEEASSLQGKTWGFKALAEQINKIYEIPETQVIAKIEFIVSSK